MPRSILILSLVLGLAALVTIGLGFSLVPTDMGRAWLNIGFILFTGFMLALTIGQATKVLAEALAKLVPQAVPVAAPSAEDVAPASSEVVEPAPVDDAPAASSPGVSPALVAAGAAALGAGVVAAGLHERPQTDAVPVEDLEKDLLLEFAAEEKARLELSAPVEVASAALEDRLPAEAVVQEPFELRLFPDEKIGAQPLFDEDTMADEPALEVEPEAEAVSVAMSDAPAGLIADEDLARLVAEEAPLAPLDTLDVVGAYDSAGVRFTMYSDGSVNAVAPQGERRYRSLEALRKQLDAGLPAV